MPAIFRIQSSIFLSPRIGKFFKGFNIPLIMNEIELGTIISFLRGNLELKNLLKYIKIESASRKEREHLKFLLKQLINIKEESYKGWQFRGGKNNIKDHYIKQVKEGKQTLEELKGYLSNGTYYRIRKEII